jgi:DNA-binding GntR family transcriptional regulator
MSPVGKGSKRKSSNGGVDVIAVLRERIAGHALPPGSRLREQDLATEFGVSRARIREAFGALEQRGLIERIPNRGALVVRSEPKQIYDIYDVRIVLEALVARRAAESGPDGAWDDLVERFGASMETALGAGDFDHYLDALEALHRAMAVHADNATLSDMLDLIDDKTRMITRRVIILPGRAEIGLRMHRALLQALVDRDGDAAEAAMREILSSARATLEKYQRFVV